MVVLVASCCVVLLVGKPLDYRTKDDINTNSAKTKIPIVYRVCELIAPYIPS